MLGSTFWSLPPSSNRRPGLADRWTRGEPDERRIAQRGRGRDLARVGEEMWDDLLVACDLEGARTALGNYPDTEPIALAEAAADRLDCPVGEVVRTLGRLTSGL